MMTEPILSFLQNSFGTMSFDNEPNGQRPKLAPDNDKNHVFYALLSYNRDKSDNKLRFTYLYSLHQKLLRASLLKEWHIAEHFKLKIELEEHLLGESDFSKTSMLSIRDPAIAFYYYHLKKDYNAALQYMSSSLKNIDILINDGFSDGMFMKIEQLLNTFRVHYTAGNYVDAANFAKHVFSYVVGSSNDFFQFPLKEVIRSNHQLHEILHLYINSILSKSINLENEPKANNDFLIAAINDIHIPLNTEIEPLFVESFNLIKLFLLPTKDEAFDKLLRTDVFNKDVPVYIQHYLLITLLAHPGVIEGASLDLLSRIGKYQKSILKLGNLGKKININQENLAA
jgi:hypothetical protein